MTNEQMKTLRQAIDSEHCSIIDIKKYIASINAKLDKLLSTNNLSDEIAFYERIVCVMLGTPLKCGASAVLKEVNDRIAILRTIK
jgi:hypothetical protein